MTVSLRALAMAVLGLVLLMSPAVLAAEQRHALVIGNSAYTGTSPLKNPVSDAQLIARTLEQTGFKVTLVTDADQKQMHKAMLEFGRTLRAAPGAVGLLYYAGHGLQVNGVNYMVPVSADIRDEAEVAVEGLDVNNFLGTMQSSGSKLNIVVLDACRNNPYARSFRSASRGLAPVQASSGMMIAYSTSPGDVAFDGEGLNSPYSLSLERFIREPGLPIETVFKRVLADVEDATERKQTPWMTTSFRGDFFFVPKGQEAPAGMGGDLTRSSGPDHAAALEKLFWESIVNSTNPASFEAYLSAFPNGLFAPLAKLKVTELSVRRTVAVAEAPRPAVPAAGDDAATSGGRSAPLPGSQGPDGAAAPAKEAEEVNNPLAYKFLVADSSTRELKTDDVKSFDCQKLWLARNEIYYRNGFCFKSEKGIRYFDNSNCSKAVVNLTPVESRNIRTIRTLEIRKLCKAEELIDRVSDRVRQ